MVRLKFKRKVKNLIRMTTVIVIAIEHSVLA